MLVRSCKLPLPQDAFQPTRRRYPISAGEVPGHMTLVVKTRSQCGIHQRESVKQQRAQYIQGRRVTKR
jgi:hypothetical protein